MNLFVATPLAREMALRWSGRAEEYVKRAGFAMMAAIAVHQNSLPDDSFDEFLAIIAREAADRRNFVRKAVSWALRQIGKRNPSLRAAAIQTAERIRASGERDARWVASDALRELTGQPTQRRGP
jgi:3-methyladenine DNA glycosylase AlkD